MDKVAFTGSTAAGRSIAEVCGRLLRPVSLELGGKSAAIVLELRPRTVEFVDAFLAADRECFGAWCEVLDRTVDPDAVVASQQPVHEAADRLRSWCANPHLRKVAELERVELLRAQVTEEQAVEAATPAGVAQLVARHHADERRVALVILRSVMFFMSTDRRKSLQTRGFEVSR